MSAPEATWRIFEFSLHKEYPAHQRLCINLPGEETVYFRDNSNPTRVMDRAANPRNTLTMWFVMNQAEALARTLLYIEFPEQYVWSDENRQWTTRQRGHGGTIGRIFSVSPREGEKYFLRLLLLHRRGATGYQDLRTIEGVVHGTFQSACRALGLLSDDSQWTNCLEEACTYQLPYQLRSLFATILIFSLPSDPFSLWLDFGENLSEDYIFRKKNELGDPAIILTEQQQQACFDNALLDIHDALQVHGKSISDFDGFTMPTTDTRREQDDEFAGLDKIMIDQLLLCREAATLPDPSLLPFNADQRTAYDAIVDAALVGPSGVFFVDGPGGTGKTYLFNAILDGVRRMNNIALAVAASGTASLLLKGGKTAHSTFKIPIELTPESTCSIRLGSDVSRLIEETQLVIWDEASMISANMFRAVERTFRDIMGAVNPECERLFFGGKLVVFGGDFRQVLPVVPRGARLQIVEQCINQQTSWRFVQRLRLTQNMRVNQALSDNDPELASRLQSFASDLLAIGNGSYPSVNNSSYVRIPQEMLLADPSLPSLFTRVFNNFRNAEDYSVESLSGKAILAATNTNVRAINRALINIFRPHDQVFEYISVDETSTDEAALMYPVEYLNTIDHSSLPPHRLILKVGCPIMMLRNVNPDEGLCNGTRLICTELHRYNIRARIITGPKSGNIVNIPRITLKTDRQQINVEFTRVQFPIRLAFATTINKSQGQTLDKVGVYLPQPVFGHGQLYVAMSRAKRSEDVTIVVDAERSTFPGEPGLYTANVVYREVLLNVCNPF